MEENAPSAVFTDGFGCGAHAAWRVLSYYERGYSDGMRSGGCDMPSQDVLPLDKAGRADWLDGFATGIQAILGKERRQ